MTSEELKKCGSYRVSFWQKRAHITVLWPSLAVQKNLDAGGGELDH